jgi:hypothetical protein
MTTPQTETPNTPDLELRERIRQIFLDEADRVTQLLDSRPNDQLLGQTEFLLRDAVHRAGALALEAALDGRKKGGTRAPV